VCFDGISELLEIVKLASDLLWSFDAYCCWLSRRLIADVGVWKEMLTLGETFGADCCLPRNWAGSKGNLVGCELEKLKIDGLLEKLDRGPNWFLKG